MKEITREQLLAIPAFEQSFKDERFKNEMDTFLGYVNACASKDVKGVIGGLLKCACEYKLDIPMYKSIFLDLAWAVLENNRSLWTRRRRQMAILTLIRIGLYILNMMVVLMIMNRLS